MKHTRKFHRNDGRRHGEQANGAEKRTSGAAQAIVQKAALGLGERSQAGNIRPLAGVEDLGLFLAALSGVAIALALALAIMSSGGTRAGDMRAIRAASMLTNQRLDRLARFAVRRHGRSAHPRVCSACNLVYTIAADCAEPLRCILSREPQECKRPRHGAGDGVAVGRSVGRSADEVTFGDSVGW